MFFIRDTEAPFHSPRNGVVLIHPPPLSPLVFGIFNFDSNNVSRYQWGMIQSFADAETEKIFRGHVSRWLPQNLQSVMHRKLVMVHAAAKLDDLRVPPGNRLEALKGDRKGQHSIRVNQQWRVCFRWTENGPDHVEILDYH